MNRITLLKHNLLQIKVQTKEGDQSLPCDILKLSNVTNGDHSVYILFADTACLLRKKKKPFFQKPSALTLELTYSTYLKLLMKE